VCLWRVHPKHKLQYCPSLEPPLLMRRSHYLSFQPVQVIYAQTDSVFVHFPSATPAEAVALGQQVAQLVSSQLPPPIELKYERVMAPFLLLHVNR
jgi:DNA polymerase elongation subunit (family B)